MKAVGQAQPEPNVDTATGPSEAASPVSLRSPPAGGWRSGWENFRRVHTDRRPGRPGGAAGHYPSEGPVSLRGLSHAGQDGDSLGLNPRPSSEVDDGPQEQVILASEEIEKAPVP